MKHLNNLAIGVFDSGVGGLTVLSALSKNLPNENFIYLGDTARVPYGGRSAHIIKKYSLEVVQYLVKKKIKLLVIACNTSTAYAEELIIKEHPTLFVQGVIQPGVEALIKKATSNKVGVAGTNSTIKSEDYKKRILKINNNLEVFDKPCPLLVPLVEEAWLDNEVTNLVIKYYFEDFIKNNVSCVVLGCTHYPLLKPSISKIYPNLQLVDSSEETAFSVKNVLIKNNMLNENITKRKIELLFTDMSNPR